MAPSFTMISHRDCGATAGSGTCRRAVCIADMCILDINGLVDGI
jgi:hypothetical protein